MSGPVYIYADKHQLLNTTILATFLLNLFLLSTSFMVPGNAPKLLYLSFSCLFFIQFLTQKFLNSYKWISVIYLWTLFVFLGYLIIHGGGLDAPAYFWLVSIPMLSLLLQNVKSAMVWSVFIILISLAILLYPDYLIARPYNGKVIWKFIAFVIMLIFVASVIIKFSHILNNQLKDLLTNNQKLTVQKAELVEMQEEVKTQYEVIAEQNKLMAENAQELDALNDQLEREYNAALRRNERMENFWKILLRTSQMTELHDGNIQKTVSKLIRLVSETLQVDQVSYWLYTDKETKQYISLETKYSREKNSYRAESAIINSNECPTYFEQLRENVSVVASDAFTHPALTELQEYLVRHRIFSLLDVPVFLENNFFALISCEHKSLRVWQPEEIIFIKSITDMINLAYKAEQRTRYKNLLEERQNRINKLNANLEKMVEERTNALMQQNQQLLDFAFINSHTIRGPLCRVMGLRNLMEMTHDPVELVKLSKMLQVAIEEMDQVIRKSSDSLDKGLVQELLQSTNREN